MSLSLPTLSDKRLLRLSAVTALYLAQGIGIGVIIISLPAVMAAKDLNVAEISGFMGLVMIPWALKFFFAPFMDRFSFLSLGRRRPWVFSGILFAALGYLAMSLVSNPFEHLSLFLAAGMISTGGTALMDVAVDGMVVDIIPVEEQAQANGLMWGGKAFGTALAAWGSGWMFKQYGVSMTFLASMAATLVFTLIPLLLRERSGEKLFPWTSGKASAASLEIQPESWRAIGRNLFRVMRLPASGIIIGLIILVGGIQGIFDALLPVITVQELGWDSDRYSQIAGISKLIAGVIGMVLRGYLVTKWGHKRALSCYLIILAAASIAMGALPEFWDKDSISIGQMFIHHTCRTLALISCFSIGMALCWKQIAASQFAFYMAFGNLGISSGSILLGRLSRTMDYPQIFFVLAAIACLAITVVIKLDIVAHQKRIQSFSP